MNPIEIFRTAWLEKASGFMVNKEKMQELLAQIPTMLEKSGLKKVGKDLVALKDYVVEAISGQLENKDVKNILVLQNWLERIRKEVTNKVLSIKRISDFLIFPILAQPTLKKI